MKKLLLILMCATIFACAPKDPHAGKQLMISWDSRDSLIEEWVDAPKWVILFTKEDTIIRGDAHATALYLIRNYYPKNVFNLK